MTSPYTKPFLTIAQQIALLQARGLGIPDYGEAQEALEEYGYYRISGYAHPLRQFTLAGGLQDDFVEGAEISHPIKLIEFDRGLRSLFLIAAERIEIALRVRVAIMLGQRGPWSHRDATQFWPRFSSLPHPGTGDIAYQVWLDKLISLEANSKEDFAEHFRENYSDPPPIWVSIELWDFGMLSRLVGGMKVADLKELAKHYGLGNHRLLPSWLRAVNHVRNVSAHHSRLWNRSPADQPKPPQLGEVPLLDHLTSDVFAQTRLYAVAAVSQYLLRKIDRGAADRWATQLKAHFETFPELPHIPVTQTGLPVAWQDLDLWN